MKPTNSPNQKSHPSHEDMVTAGMKAAERRQTFFPQMATARTISFCLFHQLLGAPGEERLNAWVGGRNRGLLRRLGTGWGGLSALEAPLEQDGRRLSPWLLFSGQKKEGGRARTTGHVQRPGMGTEWCYTNRHKHTRVCTQSQLKESANLPDSKPERSRHLSWWDNSQRGGALGLYQDTHTHTHIYAAVKLKGHNWTV